MKKRISICLVALLVVTFLAGCTSKGNEEPGATKDVDIKAVHSKVKEELGEDYMPDMELSLEELEDITGLDGEDIEEFIAVVPMISVHVDTFIAIKAKEDKADDVEGELEAYREYLNEESMQYPMNLAKVKSAKVVRHGAYLFFIMIGKPNDMEDQESAEALAFSQAQVERVEDIIDGFFK